MAKEGTYVVLGFVAHQETFFKASDVYEETGLDRPLIYYHLNNFVKKGFLEKQGQNYCVLDRKNIIEALAFGNSKDKVHGAVATKLYKQVTADTLNRAVLLTLYAKVLTLSGSRDLKERLNEEIDKTIEGLKAAKRSLNTRQIRVNKALKFIRKDEDYLKHYMALVQEFEVSFDEAVLRNAIERINEHESYKRESA